MQGIDAQRPLGELVAQLASETSTLFKKEVELAKVELSGKARHASRNAAQIGVGGAVVLLGAAAFLGGIVLLLGLVLPLWLSAISCGLVVAGLGALLLRRAMQELRGIDPVPRETVRTLEDTRQWARREVTQ